MTLRDLFLQHYITYSIARPLLASLCHAVRRCTLKLVVRRLLVLRSLPFSRPPVLDLRRPRGDPRHKHPLPIPPHHMPAHSLRP